MFQGEQLDAFRSWHRIFWFDAWLMRPTKGHALFIVGDVDAGKTLISYRLIGASVGGHTDVTNFLLGKAEFNSSILEATLGCIDDAVGTADRRSHDVYSQVVKKMVANPTLAYRRMYANPVDMPAAHDVDVARGRRALGRGSRRLVPPLNRKASPLSCR